MKRDLPAQVPYQANLFANRTKQLGIVRYEVEKIRGGEAVPFPVLHFHGVAGIGKTWLLRHLSEVYRHQPGSPQQRRDTLSVFIDGQQLSHEEDSSQAMISSAVEQLRGQFDEDDFLPPITDSLSLGQFMMKLTEDYVPIWLLDRADLLSQETTGQTEDALWPIVEDSRAIVVTSGEAQPLEWPRFRYRLYPLQELELGAFEVDDTGELTRKAGSLTDPQRLQQLTHGYPLFTSMLLGQTAEQLSDSAALIRTLKALEDNLLGRVPVQWRRALRVMSILRTFNIASTRWMLSTVLGGDFAQKSEGFYHKLLSTGFGDPDLLTWLPGPRPGYAITQVARLIMRDRLWLANPARYRIAQEKALMLYEQSADNYAQDCGRYVHEAIYHIGELRKAGGLDDSQLRQRIGELLTTRVSETNFKNITRAHTLSKDLESDRELRLLLPPPILKDIRDHLQALIRKLQ